MLKGNEWEMMLTAYSYRTPKNASSRTQISSKVEA